MNNNEVKECEFCSKSNMGSFLCTCNIFEDIEPHYCKNIKNCYVKQLRQLKVENEKFRKANNEKNEFLQQLGINSGGEFKRIKFYINTLTQKLEKARGFIKANYYKCNNCCGDKETAEVYLEGKCGGWCQHYNVKQALKELNT